MQQIIVAGLNAGLSKDQPQFAVDNDAFPVLNNANLWRQRVRKKRGTTVMGRLQRSILVTVTLSAGSVNLISALSIETTASITPGTINLIGGTDGTTYTDPSGNGTLNASGGTGTGGTINYSTGVITITGGGSETLTGTIGYYPALPVMGIETFDLAFATPNPTITNFPLSVWFDTKYSYIFTQPSGPFYDVNYYASSGLHFTWSGIDYQQFWSTNHQGALWVTNGKPGFSFDFISAVTANAGSTVTFTIATSQLVLGDWVSFNEFPTAQAILNGKSGVLTTISGTSYTFTFPAPITVTTGATTSGIDVYLTNSKTGQDGIKYFLGDPTGNTAKGWVNFAPPLQNSIAPTYLVGAQMIIPFKDRLLFFGTYTATSANPSPVYNPNQLIASQNGTAFYAGVSNSTLVGIYPGTLPKNQTSDPAAYYNNIVGRGIRLNAPFSQEVINVGVNHDALIVIFENNPLRLYSTGDDSAPFLYQTISSDFGGQSTFSSVALGTSLISLSSYGFTQTTETKSERIDLQIPDEVYDVQQLNNGNERVTAIRDWRNELIYFSFPSNDNAANNGSQSSNVYPNTTLVYNYRDNNWATYEENVTHYGYFRPTMSRTWAQLGELYGTWADWQDPWNFGSSAAAYPFVVYGNQQGFILQRNDSTNESSSLYISAIAGVTITSPSHGLNDGDYIIINGAIGPPGITAINGLIYQIGNIMTDSFNLIPAVINNMIQPTPSGTYLGGGVITRLINIQINTRQFPLFWTQGRQIRIGTCKYLLEKTPAGSITVNMYASQNDVQAGTRDPSSSAQNQYQPFTNVLLTCYEGSDLNLTQSIQDQIWHRTSTSLVGDSIQLQFSLSDAQMRDINSNQEEIILYAFILNAYPGPLLAL
jgi:hypothetical protein